MGEAERLAACPFCGARSLPLPAEAGEAWSTFNVSVDDGTVTLHWRHKDTGVMLVFSPDGTALVSRKSGRGDLYTANTEPFDPREGLPSVARAAIAVMQGE